MAVSVIINSTDSNSKSAQKSITNINPDATASGLLAFGQAFNAVSNNTYVDTNRVEKVKLDGLSSATITFAGGSSQDCPDYTDEGSSTNFAYTYNGNGNVYIKSISNDRVFGNISEDGLNVVALGSTDCTIILRADATSAYSATESTLTLNEKE